MFRQSSRLARHAPIVQRGRSGVHFSVAISAIAAACVATPIAATTLFQEDFESYAVGSNLTGQGGWVPDYVNSTLNIGNGTFLPGKVLNGLDRTNSAENITARPLGFALDPNRITTFAFDAYASRGSSTHNASVGLGSSSISDFQYSGVFWNAELYYSPTGSRWTFDVRALTGNSSALIVVSGGYDTPVKMSIVVDGVANEVYGIYDFGSGPQQTPHYAVTDAQIATLNEVGVHFDFRNWRGAEIDNLRVFDNVGVPEPGTALLLAASLGLLGFGRRSR